MGIAVRNLSKRFGSFHAVDDVSFDVPSGQLVALLGPSGSGKSTILRIIAGLEDPDSGSVSLTGEDATHLPVQSRGVGFVFQHYALFRHMSIRQNIAFGLEVLKLPKAEIRQRVDELLNLVQLAGYADRFPTQLSGGQRQRVAIARALARDPQVLLLDEPFSAVDRRTRTRLHAEIAELREGLSIPMLLVTHDLDEVSRLSDRIALIDEGAIRLTGRPDAVLSDPVARELVWGEASLQRRDGEYWTELAHEANPHTIL